MALMLEVLDARGAMRTRVRVADLPLRIGRALDNDLILDDPYVDAQHAQLTVDDAGALTLEDLGSRNGVVPAGQQRAGRVAVAPGVELRLGRTTLRFRDPSEAVAPALLDTLPGARFVPRWATTVPGQLALTLSAVIAIGVDTWLGSYQRSAAGATFEMMVGLALIGGVWAGCWAIAGRIIVHRFRFLAHSALLAALLLVLWGWTALSEWLAFVFPDNRAADIAGTLFMLLFVVVLVAGHLGIASALTARRRWQAGAVTGAILLGLVGVGALTADDSFSDVPEFAVTVKVIGARWLPTRSVAEFGEAAAQLKDEVDSLLEK